MCPSQKMLRRLPALVLVLSLGVVLSLAACSKAPSDAQRIDEAVDRLKSGAVIQDVEEKMSEGQETSDAGQAAGPTGQGALVFKDPCPGTGMFSVLLNDEGKARVLNEFAACLRRQLEPVNVASGAIEYFKTYKMDPQERPLSAMTDSEILEYAEANYVNPLAFLKEADGREAKVRGSFTDAELDELMALIARKRAALERAEASIFGAVDAREELVREAALKVDRYALLAALRDTASEPAGRLVAQKIAEAVKNSGMTIPDDLGRFPGEMLHPYGIQAVVPDEGMEQEPLDTKNENPFLNVLKAVAELQGPEEMVQRALSRYKNARDIDNPALPQHPAPAKDAVRVAFIDSGIDWVTHPDLGLFLGTGENGSIAQGDFADGDKNPWLPSTGELAHGSGTSASLLTILAHYAPEVLTERRLDLAMWKAYTVRDFLSGPAAGLVRWGNRLPVVEAIVRKIEASSRGDQSPAPKIVSVSMGFGINRSLIALGKEGLLLKAPWLWVMSAGNESAPLEHGSPPECFSDVPAENRRDENILCVGALIPGIVNDKIADYSNFGDRVDVYAHESYIGLCPSGTSCATPAVSAAATVIASKFPSLTPAQIKRAIVEASEERELEIDYPDPEVAPLLARLRGEWSITRKVKVFNPPAMIGKALDIARTLSKNQGAAVSRKPVRKPNPKPVVQKRPKVKKAAAAQWFASDTQR